jgi:hypothetical protein
MQDTTLDLDGRYAVAGHDGIAFWLKDYVRTLAVDEDGEPIIGWLGDCEDAYDVDTSMVIAVMVGDDREHVVDVDDLTPLEEDAYCAGCGQLGCGWH